MTNEKAFELYFKTRLHFLTSYDVFENSGKVRGLGRLRERKDFPLIVPIAKKVQNERNLIEFCVSNFLYGNDNFLYDENEYAEQNYIHWLKVKESIGRTLQRDLNYIELQCLTHECSLNTYFEKKAISDLLSRKIEYESIIMLNRHQPVIDYLSGFESDKYKVRMHKANMFVTKGTLAPMHISHIDKFLSNLT